MSVLGPHRQTRTILRISAFKSVEPKCRRGDSIDANDPQGRRDRQRARLAARRQRQSTYQPLACGQLDTFDGYIKHISDAAFGADDARCARVALELAPEAKNLNVDTAIEDVLVHAGRLQQMFTAERTLWGFQKSD